MATATLTVTATAAPTTAAATANTKSAAASPTTTAAALPKVHDFAAIPIIDIDALFLPKNSGAENEKKRQAVAAELYNACRSVGFFYVRNHRISKALIDTLFSEGQRFFSMPVAFKNAIHMKQSGEAFRGYFMLGEELTSKKKDWKEGLYFGAENLPTSEEVSKLKLPMHGTNLWPDKTAFPAFDHLISNYMTACTELGHTIMEGIAIGLQLPTDYFRTRFTTQPFTPFRLFWYPIDMTPEEREAMQKTDEQNAKDGTAAAPPSLDSKQPAASPSTTSIVNAPAASTASPKVIDPSTSSALQHPSASSPPNMTYQSGDGKWGVGEHTDYGVLTILAQDNCGGLQVKNCRGEWIEATPVPDTFVINIGDMLERWTRGLLKATPHRVAKSQHKNRLSAPFFFDPNFQCLVEPLNNLPGIDPKDTNNPKYANGSSILYGDYISAKVRANFAEMNGKKKATAGLY